MDNWNSVRMYGRGGFKLMLLLMLLMLLMLLLFFSL